MSNFGKFCNVVVNLEGGYSNRKADAGGETYKGISRKYHSDWAGWAIVDAYKELHDDFTNEELTDRLSVDDSLAGSVRAFYKKKFWDIFRLDEVESDWVQFVIFDTGVNCGTGYAPKAIQRTLNFLNREERDWDDITVDGKIGPITIKIINLASKKRLKNFVEGYLGLRIARYVRLSEDPKRRDELNINGWFNRIQHLRRYPDNG